MSRKAFTDIYHFNGAAAVPAVASRDGGKWTKAITGAAPPTVVEAGGYMALSLTNANQVQIACLYQADILSYDIDDLISARFWARVTTALTGTADLAFGLASARNDTHDSIAQMAVFRCVQGSSTVLVETDDGTTDNDDKSTGGQTLGSTLKLFEINFEKGTSDVRFLMGDANGNLRRVAKDTTFSMAAYTGGLQPIATIQKGSGTDVGVLELKRIEIDYRIN